MTRDSSRLPYEDWGRKSVQPIVFRQGWPSSSSPQLYCAPLMAGDFISRLGVVADRDSLAATPEAAAATHLCPRRPNQKENITCD